MSEERGLSIKSALKGLTPRSAEQLEAVFLPMIEKLREFDQAYETIANKDVTISVTGEAKRLRLDIRKIRTEAKKAHKEQKAGILLAGKAVDGVYNILLAAVTPKEDALKDIEDHFINIEKEAIRIKQEEREDLLDECGYNYNGVELGSMSDDAFELMHKGAKIAQQEYEAEQDRIERESEINDIYHDRREKLLVLSDYCDPNLLRKDSTEEEYLSLFQDANKKRIMREEKEREDDISRRRLEKEKELSDKITQKKIEDEKLRSAQKQKEADKLIQEEKNKTFLLEKKIKEQEEKALSEKLAKQGLCDSEKLLGVMKSITEVGKTLQSEGAKIPLRKCIEILREARTVLSND